VRAAKHSLDQFDRGHNRCLAMKDPSPETDLQALLRQAPPRLKEWLQKVENGTEVAPAASILYGVGEGAAVHARRTKISNGPGSRFPPTSCWRVTLRPNVSRRSERRWTSRMVHRENGRGCRGCNARQEHPPAMVRDWTKILSRRSFAENYQMGRTWFAARPTIAADRSSRTASNQEPVVSNQDSR
jgi:hypothetical protein